MGKRIQLLVLSIHSTYWGVFFFPNAKIFRTRTQPFNIWWFNSVWQLISIQFHAELAGEGVGNCWARAKPYNRCSPVSCRRGREKVKDLFTSLHNVITKDRVELFAAKARAYICTYHRLEQARDVPPRLLVLLPTQWLLLQMQLFPNRSFSSEIVTAKPIGLRTTPFCKDFSETRYRNARMLATAQEAKRKDIKRAFGMLQARFHILQSGCCLWNRDAMKTVIKTRVIFHILIIDHELINNINLAYIDGIDCIPSHPFTFIPQTENQEAEDRTNMMAEMKNTNLHNRL